MYVRDFGMWNLNNEVEKRFNELSSRDVAFMIKADIIENAENYTPIGNISSFQYKGCIGYLVFNVREAQEAFKNNIPYIYYFNDREMFESMDRVNIEKYLCKAHGVVIDGFPHNHILRIISNTKLFWGYLIDDEKNNILSDIDRWVSISPGDGYIYIKENIIFIRKIQWIICV